MKQMLFTLCVLFLVETALGQNIIDKHFLTYKDQDNFTSIHISAKAFELTAYLEFEDADEDFNEFKEFLSTVKSFDMIAGREVDNAEKKYLLAVRKVQASHDELMKVDDKDGNVTFLVDESNGIVKELVMVAGQPDNLAIFSLTGNMELSQLSKMSRMMNADGAGQIQKMFDNGIHELKVYPNPLNQGKQLTIEIPEDMKSGTVNLLNMNGVKVKSFSLNSMSNKLDTDDLAAGNYILEFKNENVSIKRKIIIR